MGQSVDRIRGTLAAWLLPSRCVLCHASGQRPVLDLCAPCEADLPRQPRGCPKCGLPHPLEPRSPVCARCRADPPPWDRCHAAFQYAFPMDGLVHDLKYRGHLAVARVLGTLLGRAVTGAALHHDVDLVLPVPLHPDKLVERGFNQSVEIARWVARETGLRHDPRFLRRIRPTRPQVGLSLTERLDNLRGAFAATGNAGSWRVAVVDDVMTTGSTLREIAGVLRRGGAERVDVWCVARTPE